MKPISIEIKTKTSFFETISKEMKPISKEIKTKKSFFETSSKEMKTKKSFFETSSKEMNTVTREIIFISNVLWSHFDPPACYSKRQTDNFSGYTTGINYFYYL